MKKKAIIIVLIASIMVFTGVAIIIIAYVKQFGGKYSDDLNDWAAFGDYISGLVNTLIAIASLLMIGFITILLGKDKDDYRFERRNDAYDLLMEYIPKINLAPKLGDQLMKDYSRQISLLTEEVVESKENQNTDGSNDVRSFKNKKNQLIQEFSRDYNKQMVIVREYQLFLKNFSPRYSHLFKKYDFSGKHKSKYDNLIKSSAKVAECLELYRDVVTENSDKSIDDIPLEKSAEAHFDLLTEFINELQDEL